MGRWERTLLRQSAELGPDKSLPIPPPDLSNTELSALRRAVESLTDKGLVELLRDKDGQVIVERRYRRVGPDGKKRLERRERFLLVTRLGQAVVGACGDELVPGRWLRWTELLPTVKRSILDQCGCVPARERDRFV
jgi:DNA-binding transcriptional ArsR family regulator